MYHQFKSSTSSLSKDDAGIIYKDSLINSSKMNLIKSLLTPYGIIDFDYSRIYDDNSYEMVVSYSKDDILEYLETDIWYYQHLFNSESVLDYYVIDFSKSSLPIDKNYLKKLEPYYTIAVERKILDCKNSFTFSIDKSVYNKFDPMQFFKLNYALNTCIELMLSTIRFSTRFKLTDSDIKKFKTIFKKHHNKVSDQHKLEAIQSRYGLNALEANYLRAIATGSSAKEIALNVNKSYRYIQNIIQSLVEKLDLNNKNELAQVAKLIVASI
ncbi:LuxR C-terminal-related transcriptional regulator [Francisellaceae bacterium]|nr:LuxR C-terminal-related transcriptional regulator [Francisellaceae bacterium]